MANKRSKSLMPIDTGEWLDSPRINNLSYEIRGMWLTMLCYLWESPTRGIMAYPNGKLYTKGQILRTLDIDPIALEILVENGLLAVDDKGAYYSPEMVRKERISAIRRTAGRKGGEITMRKVIEQQAELPETPAPVIVEPPPENKQEPPQPQLFDNEDVPQAPPELTPVQKAKAEKKKKYQYADYVSMTQEEYAKLCEKYGEDETKGMIDLLSNYIGSKGCYSKYKSHYRAILSWVADAYYERQQRYGTRPPTITTTPKSAGGTPATPGYATGALQAPAGAGPQSGDAPEEGYAERF